MRTWSHTALGAEASSLSLSKESRLSIAHAFKNTRLFSLFLSVLHPGGNCVPLEASLESLKLSLSRRYIFKEAWAAVCSARVELRCIGFVLGELTRLSALMKWILGFSSGKWESGTVLLNQVKLCWFFFFFETFASEDSFFRGVVSSCIDDHVKMLSY